MTWSSSCHTTAWPGPHWLSAGDVPLVYHRVVLRRPILSSSVTDILISTNLLFTETLQHFSGGLFWQFCPRNLQLFEYNKSSTINHKISSRVCWYAFALISNSGHSDGQKIQAVFSGMFCILNCLFIDNLSFFVSWWPWCATVLCAIQVGLMRQQLSTIYEREQNWREAANILVGIPLETAQKSVVVSCNCQVESFAFTGCLQLLEILEIYWNLCGPHRNFCIKCWWFVQLNL